MEKENSTEVTSKEPVKLFKSQELALAQVKELLEKGNREIIVVGLMGAGKSSTLDSVEEVAKVLDVDDEKNRDLLKNGLPENSPPIIWTANLRNEDWIGRENLPKVVLRSANKAEMLGLLSSSRYGTQEETDTELEKIADYSLGLTPLASNLLSQVREEDMVLISSGYLIRNLPQNILEDIKKVDLPEASIKVREFLGTYLQTPIPEKVIASILDRAKNSKFYSKNLAELERRATENTHLLELNEPPALLKAVLSKSIYEELLTGDKSRPENKQRTGIAIMAPWVDKDKIKRISLSLGFDDKSLVETASRLGSENQLESGVPNVIDADGCLDGPRCSLANYSRKYSIGCADRENVKENLGKETKPFQAVSIPDEILNNPDFRYLTNRSNERALDLLELASMITTGPENSQHRMILTFNTWDHEPIHTAERAYVVETLLQQLGIPYFVQYGGDTPFSFDPEKNELQKVEEPPVSREEIYNGHGRNFALPEAFDFFFRQGRHSRQEETS